MRHLKSERGTSLIEIAAAIGLFSIVATGVSTAIVSNVKLNSMSRMNAIATALVQNKIEEIRAIVPVANQIPAALTIGTHADASTTVTALDGATGSFTRTWKVSAVSQYLAGVVVGNRPDVVQVEVIVKYITPKPGSISAVTFACTSPTCG